MAVRDRSCLTRSDAFKLAESLKALNGELTTGKHTYESLASYLAGKHGIRVSSCNVRGLLGDLGIELPVAARRRNDFQRNSGRIDETERQLAALTALMTEQAERYAALQERLSRLEQLAKAIQ